MARQTPLEKIRNMSKKERKAYMKKRKEEFLNEQNNLPRSW